MTKDNDNAVTATNCVVLSLKLPQLPMTSMLLITDFWYTVAAAIRASMSLVIAPLDGYWAERNMSDNLLSIASTRMNSSSLLVCSRWIRFVMSYFVMFQSGSKPNI